MDPAAERTVWEENSPDSLLDIAARYVLYHPETYSQVVRLPGNAKADKSTSAGGDAEDDDFVLVVRDVVPGSGGDGGLEAAATVAGAVGGSGDVGAALSFSPATSPHHHNYTALTSSSSANTSRHHRRHRHHHRHKHRTYDLDDDDEDEDTFPDEEMGGEERGRLQVRLLPDLQLPTEVCEKLFSMLHQEGLDVTDETAAIFGDTSCARLRRVSVRESSLTDAGLAHLLKHDLHSLDVHNCAGLTGGALELLNRRASALVSLNVGNSTQILPDYVTESRHRRDEDEDDDEDSLDEEDKEAAVYDERGYILRAPRLQRLAMRELYVTGGQPYLDLLLRPLPGLTHLDLSELKHVEGLGDFAFLRHLPRLASLVLHNVQGLDAAVESVLSLGATLKHLDISQSDEKLGFYSEPNRTLARLVTGLPGLQSLDISGTNLAGTGAFEPASLEGEAAAAGSRRRRHGKEEEQPMDSGGSPPSSSAASRCDIPGLVSRADRPLDFLGLYKTTHEACCRRQIPALAVSGDSTQRQILAAGRQYLDRPAMLENVLNDLFHVFRYEECSDLRGALDVILMAMARHPGEKVIQISGSASLYYVVRSEVRASINLKMRRKVLSTLLNGMFAHRNDHVMMRNGCLTICQFSIPQDIAFDYERLVKILLYIVSEHTAEDSFIQRAGIYLLNSIACQVTINLTYITY